MAKDVMEKEKQYNLKQVRLQLLQQASKAFAFSSYQVVRDSVLGFRSTLMKGSDARKQFDKELRELVRAEEKEQLKLKQYLKNPRQFLEVPDRKIEWEDKIDFTTARYLCDISWAIALEHDLIPKE